jgi:hypothetical protein
LVKRIYHDLTGQDLPETMPLRERRPWTSSSRNAGRRRAFLSLTKFSTSTGTARTIRVYPRPMEVAFDRHAWLQACESKRKLEGSGFGRRCPPLFPGEGRRHRQQAFRDALTDVLPVVHGWEPTLRIADVEVVAWIGARDAKTRMAELLSARM